MQTQGETPHRKTLNPPEDQIKNLLSKVRVREKVRESPPYLVFNESEHNAFPAHLRIRTHWEQN